jgi:methionyl-tRNA synthetase
MGESCRSRSAAHDPVEHAARYGSDALRWWFLRDVPRSAEADFRAELLARRANELANGLGNLINRTNGLIVRFRPQGVGAGQQASDAASALAKVIAGTPAAIDDALRRFDFRAATGALWRLMDEANRCVTTTRPWELAKAEQRADYEAGAQLDHVLRTLLDACHALARELQPFLPAAATRLSRALTEKDPELGRRLFAKATADPG